MIVEQAKGILARRHGISPATAYEQMRSDARSRNTKVHDIARQIIEGMTL